MLTARNNNCIRKGNALGMRLAWISYLCRSQKHDAYIAFMGQHTIYTYSFGCVCYRIADVNFIKPVLTSNFVVGEITHSKISVDKRFYKLALVAKINVCQ